MRTPRPITLIVFVVAFYAKIASAQAVAPAPSASVPPQEKSEVVELSPFVVHGTTNKGYEAQESLSGTRLKTASKFIGAAVTDVTPQLMQDAALFSTEDVLNLTPNASSYNGGGLANDPNGNLALFGPTFYIRGLIVGTTGRDFIKNRVIDDAYNTERTSVNRGPNSILFGIGDPGGLINVVGSRAEMKDSFSVSARVDNWGSHREAFRLNKQLVPKKLSIFLAGLNENKKTNRDPSDLKSERLTGSLTFRPFANTTLRASAEDGMISRIFVRPWAGAGDAITPWLNAGQQPMPTAALNGGVRFATVPAPTAAQRAQQTAILNQMIAAGYNLAPSGNGAVPGVVVNGLGSLPPLDMLGLALTAPATVGSARIADPTLLNSPIPYTVNPLGRGMALDQDFQNYTFSLEQGMGKHFFLELLYNRQNTNNLSNVSGGNIADQLFLDEKPTMVTMTGAVVPNPNQHRYLTVNSAPSATLRYFDDETLRGSLAFKYDFRDRMKGLLGRILGHHDIAVIRERYTTDFIQHSGPVLNAAAAKYIGVTPQFPAGASTNIRTNSAIVYLRYIDPNDSSTWAGPDYFHQSGFDNKPIFAGMSLPSPGANGIALAYVPNASQRSLQIINSQSLTLQDYFWEDRIVTTFGIRRDEADFRLIASKADTTNGVSGFVRNAGDVDPYTGTADNPVSYTQQAGQTRTEGIVVFPLPWLGVFYNQSENFTPVANAQQDLYGRALPASRGKGKDYGIKLSLWDGRLFATFSKYTTEQVGAPSAVMRNGIGGANTNTGMLTPLNSIQTTLDPLTNDSLFDSWPWNNSAWVSTNDQVAEGYEISLTANPTPNWRIMVNFSHQTAVASNYGVTEEQWVAETEAYIKQKYPQHLNTLGGNGNRGVPETVNQLFEDVHTVLQQAQTLSGRQDARQPQYSGNFVTAYDFTTGKLKNVGIGMSYRWRSRNAIGYAFQPGSTVLFNPDVPFMGSTENPLGLFVSYKFRIGRRIRASAQLNADGINLDEGLYPFTATDSGNGTPVVSRYSVGRGKTYALSLKFDY